MRIYLFFTLLVLCTALAAQELAPTLVAPASGYVETDGGSLGWSIGEVAIEQIEQDGARLSQGFQQIEIDTNTIALPNDPKTLRVIIPNFLTPNGDGVHDVFDPIGALRDQGIRVTESQSEMTIVNRWGELIHSPGAPYRAWEGMSSRGRPLPQATYYYILIIHRGQKDAVIKGPVNLLR